MSSFDYSSLDYISDAGEDNYERAEAFLHEGTFRRGDIDMSNYDDWGYLELIELFSY